MYAPFLFKNRKPKICKAVVLWPSKKKDENKYKKNYPKKAQKKKKYANFKWSS